MSKLNENKMRNEIMMLALDMINNAKSGHPGIVLSSGTIMYTLFANHLNYDLDRPDYCNRDRDPSFKICSPAWAAPCAALRPVRSPRGTAPCRRRRCLRSPARRAPPSPRV